MTWWNDQHVEDGFDNDESGGSPLPWPHQARVWARPPPPDKVREKIIMLEILLFCRMMKNRDRWLKKFIGNLNSINLLLGSFYNYIEAKLAWTDWHANNCGWDNPYLVSIESTGFFGERAKPFYQNRQVVLVKFTSCVIEPWWIYRVFFHRAFPKKLKYGTPRLGESTLMQIVLDTP